MSFMLGLNSVSAALDDIIDNVTALNLTAGNISEQVDIVTGQLRNLTTECMSSGLNMTGACASIPDPDSIQSVDVTTQVSWSAYAPRVCVCLSSTCVCLWLVEWGRDGGTGKHIIIKVWQHLT